MMAKEKPPITVVGDVGGRIAIIVVWPCIIVFMHRGDTDGCVSVGLSMMVDVSGSTCLPSLSPL